MCINIDQGGKNLIFENTEGGGFVTRERTIYKTFLSTGEKIGFKPLIGRARDTIGFQFRQQNGVVNGIKCLF